MLVCGSIIRSTPTVQSKLYNEITKSVWSICEQHSQEKPMIGIRCVILDARFEKKKFDNTYPVINCSNSALQPSKKRIMYVFSYYSSTLHSSKNAFYKSEHRLHITHLEIFLFYSYLCILLKIKPSLTIIIL